MGWIVDALSPRASLISSLLTFKISGRITNSSLSAHILVILGGGESCCAWKTGLADSPKWTEEMRPARACARKSTRQSRSGLAAMQMGRSPHRKIRALLGCAVKLGDSMRFDRRWVMKLRNASCVAPMQGEGSGWAACQTGESRCRSNQLCDTL